MNIPLLASATLTGKARADYAAFRARVLADGAEILSDAQIRQELERLNRYGLYSKFSALYTPAVRNTSKFYSIISADGDATVTRGSVKNIIDADGVLEQIASNVTPSSFGTGGWGALVEGARTNLALRSEEFDNAVWTKNGTTVTANDAIAPDGTTTADLIFPNSTGADRRIQRSVSVVNGTTYTVSIFAKASGLSWIRFLEPQSFVIGAWFNVSNGTIGTVNSGVSANIEDYGNGWYRCSITRTVTASTTGQYYINLVDANGTGNVTANSTDGILFWGAQLEAGSFASSYIKTEGATATRNADVITKTGASDLIGQEQGTLFAVVDVSFARSFTRIIGYGSGTTNRIAIQTRSNNKLRLEVNPNSSTAVSYETTNSYTIGLNKLAVTKDGDVYTFYLNGVESSPITIPGLLSSDTIAIGYNPFESQQFFDPILLAGIGKTALTEAEAIALTT